MEAEGSLRYSRQPATGSMPSKTQFSEIVGLFLQLLYMHHSSYLPVFNQEYKL